MSIPTLTETIKELDSVVAAAGWLFEGTGLVADLNKLGSDNVYDNVGSSGEQTSTMELGVDSFILTGNEFFFKWKVAIRDVEVRTGTQGSSGNTIDAVLTVILEDQNSGYTATQSLSVPKEEVQSDFDFEITAWDNGSSAPLDASDLSISFRVARAESAPDDAWVALIDYVQISFFTFEPTKYTPKMFLPPHCRTTLLHEKVEVPGGDLESVLGYDPSGAIPDKAELVVTSDAHPPSGTVLARSGQIAVRGDDENILLPATIWPDKAAIYGAARFAWQTPTGLVWSAWSSTTFNQRIGKPVVPHLEAALNGDQVDLVGFSCDNLMSCLYSGFNTTAGFDDTDVNTPIALLGSPTYSWEQDWETPEVAFLPARVIRITAGSTTDTLSQFEFVPVKADEDYVMRVRVNVNTVGGGAGTIRLGIRFYGNAGLVANSVDGGTAVADGTSQVLSHTATAPFNAVWAVCTVEQLSIANAADYVELAEFSLRRDAAHVVDADFAQGGYIAGTWFRTLGADDPLDQDFYQVIGTNATVTPADTTDPALGTFDVAVASTDSTMTVVRFYQAEGPFLPEAWPGGTLKALLQASCSIASAFVAVGVRFTDENNQIVDEVWGDPVEVNNSTHVVVEATDMEVPLGATRTEFLVGVAGVATFYLDTFRLFFGDYTYLLTVDEWTGPYGSPFSAPAGWLAIERQLPNQDWVNIAMEPINPQADIAFTDYVKPEGWTAKYRACIYGLSNGALVQGPYTDEIDITTATVQAESYALWDPTQDLSVRFDLDGTNPTLTFSLLSSMNAYSPIGADRRVITKDTSKGRSYQMLVDSIEADDLTLWESLHRVRNVLVLSRPSTGDVTSVILRGDPQVTIMNTDPVQHQLTIILEEVDVPPIW